MRVILVRHGIAESSNPNAVWGLNDELRPLTKLGQKRVLELAKSLKLLCQSVDQIFSSELVRACETAQIFNSVYKLDQIQIQRELMPGGDLDRLQSWLTEFADHEQIICVSHEPSISAFAALLLTGSPSSFFSFGRGSIACIEFKSKVKAGYGVLKFFLPGEF